MESVFVEVPKDLKGYVIGKGGYKKNEIMQQSGAIIRSLSREEEGFTVIGNAEQIERATMLMLETVEEAKISKWEQVEIPDEYKGRVIGKGGAKLVEISAQTGVSLTRKGGEVYIIRGTEQQRQHARVNIGDIVASARLKGVENEFSKARCYIDGSYLPEDSKLKFEKALEEDRMSLPGPHTQQYRLKPVEENGTKVACKLNNTNYQKDLANDALDSLRKIKDEMRTTEYPKADMWCHLGTSIVRGPEEGDFHEDIWSIDEATKMLQSTDGGNYLKVTFRERVDLQEDIFKRNFQEEIPEDNAFIARYDLTYLTPGYHYLRCKIWVAKESIQKTLEDVPIPFSDVKNVLEEIQFEDRMTQSRCRGWLVLKSRKYLQSDILFPGCEFDCRLTIRERADHVRVTEEVPEQNVRRILSTYLSGLTLAEEDPFGLLLPEENIPEGFHLIHKRCCKRTMYTSPANPGFSIILSKENSWWRNVLGKEESRESTDLHLHCDECDKLLNSKDWEPEDVAAKLPNFIQFVKDVQGIVVNEMERNGSTQTIPPEILARGPSALEAYHNALAEGETCVKRVPLMLIGQNRSGKTSLKKSLRGIRFNPEEDSTVGIDVDCDDFKVTTEIWETGKKDEETNSDTAAISFEHNAARLVAEKLREEKSVTESKGAAFSSASSFDSEITDMLMETQLIESPGDPDPINISEDSTPTNIVDEPPLQAREVPDTNKLSQENDAFFTTKVPDFEEVAEITEKLLQHDELENENGIFSILWDFAGQSVYYTTHPLFLTGRAIYFLVYNLSQNPQEKAKPLVKQGVYKKFEDSFNVKKNLDYLDFWMTSVASLASQDGSNRAGRENKLPAVFLVCTHADKPHDGCDPWELAINIFGSLKTKSYGPQLSDVFVVDNTKSGSESECEEVMRLREAVLNVAKTLPHINEVIPVKWLKYEKALQIVKKEGHKCISLEQARHIASKMCNINKDSEIRTVLNFLHDLRILIHFDDTPELNNVVVLDPQWLIDVFKKVITVRRYDWKEKEFFDLWCKLETEGILEEKLLEHVWGPLIRNKQTSESFIAIMEKFGLLCTWPFSDVSCTKQYLVPSMLKSHPPEAITKLVASAQIPSFYVKFDSGQVPPGFFPRLVLQFYQWGKENFWLPESPKLYQGFARFYISGNEDCSVILLCHSSSIEVVYHRGSCESMEVVQSEMTLSTDLDCNTPSLSFTRAVCRQLSLILECMRNQFCWLNNMSYKMCVICPVCCQGNAVEFCDTHHEKSCSEEKCLHFWSESELRDASRNIICTKSASAQTGRVNAKYWSAWFSSPDDQITPGKQDGGLFLEEANDESTLALPGGVQESLLSKTSDCKEVVHQLKESLHPDQATLKEPDAETKVLIRCLARKAKFSDRLDVFKHLRDIVPAGTTGPLLSESLYVQNIPFQQRRNLTISLSGGDEWKLVAEKLGLSPDEVRFLDKGILNPADAMLGYVARQYNITVGDLYDLLKDCDLPVMADHL